MLIARELEHLQHPVFHCSIAPFIEIDGDLALQQLRVLEDSLHVARDSLHMAFTEMVLRYLWNGWTDFVQIWHPARYHTPARKAPLKTVARAVPRAHVRFPSLYLRNYWSD